MSPPWASSPAKGNGVEPPLAVEASLPAQSACHSKARNSSWKRRRWLLKMLRSSRSALRSFISATCSKRLPRFVSFSACSFSSTSPASQRERNAKISRSFFSNLSSSLSCWSGGLPGPVRFPTCRKPRSCSARSTAKASQRRRHSSPGTTWRTSSRSSLSWPSSARSAPLDIAARSPSSSRLVFGAGKGTWQLNAALCQPSSSWLTTMFAASESAMSSSPHSSSLQASCSAAAGGGGGGGASPAAGLRRAAAPIAGFG
mmetsp:Transcript_39611/g.84445  ORF Transcript_39611/g.84445 Transcript_39611/m.84445 type:complete len:258 (+) Transcript_39611:119-892(+)